MQKIRNYDLTSPRAIANPYPIYAQMRTEQPVYRVSGYQFGMPTWLLTRYDDCAAFLKDLRFGKEVNRKMSDRQMESIDWMNAITAINRHMLTVDPPDHTRLRSLVSKAFTPRMVEGLRPRIEQIANELIDTFIDEGKTDLIASYASILPVIVIAELLGIPVEDRQKFREWSDLILFDGLRGQNFHRVGMAGLEFIMYFNEIFDQRRANPKNDLISGLLAVEEAGDTLGQQELLSMIFLLLVAGHETTINLIGNGMLALFEHPDQMEKLKQNPKLIKSAVEEMLRYNGPVATTTVRYALEDVVIRGEQISRGQVVIALLLAANHDPNEFLNPEKFDITREPNRHIAFGSGIHYCLGAPLARLEGAIGINTLLSHLPDLHLSVQPQALRWKESALLHGLQSLPVSF